MRILVSPWEGSNLFPGRDAVPTGDAAACWLVAADNWTNRHKEVAIGMPLPLPAAEEKLNVTVEGTERFCTGPSSKKLTGGEGSTQMSISLQATQHSIFTPQSSLHCRPSHPDMLFEAAAKVKGTF